MYKPSENWFESTLPALFKITVLGSALADPGFTAAVHPRPQRQVRISQKWQVRQVS